MSRSDREYSEGRSSRSKSSRSRSGRGSSSKSTSSRGYSDRDYDFDRSSSGRRRSSGKRSSGKSSKNKGKNNKISRNIGLVLVAIQAVASVVFMGTVFMLNMLPGRYVATIGAMLLLLCSAVLVSQYYSRKKGIAGKVISVLISICLIAGSYYIAKGNSTLNDITGSEYKLDRVVVAVKSDDAADSINDAASYNFGVQYAMNGDQIKDAVSQINSELGSDIATVEYKSLAEQAKALQDGKVGAIIYNEGYTSILNEAVDGYSDSVKIIYTYEIKTAVENTAEDVEVDKSFCVYISGIDVYGAIETNSRSDVNIIAEVNPETHQILLVTTPRDYYVEIPNISGGQKDKLTHAGIYGVDASMATLEQLYDTDIDFYARVNFTSLVDIVNALGGVDVDSEIAFTTSEDSGLVMNVVQGTNHFNGQQALAFSRERYNLDGGDNQRGKNQQAVIVAMIKKMVSPAILMGANDILNSVSGNVDTNMSTTQIQDLIKTQLDEAPKWSIKSMSATGTGDEQICYSYQGSALYVMQPDQTSVDAIKAAITSLKNGETLDDVVVTE